LGVSARAGSAETTSGEEVEFLPRERERAEIPPATLFDSWIAIREGVIDPIISLLIAPRRETALYLDLLLDHQEVERRCAEMEGRCKGKIIVKQAIPAPRASGEEFVRRYKERVNNWPPDQPPPTSRRTRRGRWPTSVPECAKQCERPAGNTRPTNGSSPVDGDRRRRRNNRAIFYLAARLRDLTARMSPDTWLTSRMATVFQRGVLE
jgi:hypothetical protein